MNKSGPTAPPTYEAIIVGAGFGGMGAAIQLKRLGIDSILMLERADDLGGTWHLNTYPGLAVDIVSLSYSYSFEPNPNWSRLYAPGRELKAYAQHVADKYDLRRFMRFGTSVERADYDASAGMWRVQPTGQPPVTARFLVLATGFLSQPKRPDIPGVDSFAGKVIHTAEWDHTFDLTGKRAAMIGTGASAVQVMPKIADKLAHLDVYQRTPIWVLPRTNPRIPGWLQKLFARVPLVQRYFRWWSDTILEFIMVGGVLHNRQLPFLTRMVERVCKRFLAHQVKDPELRRKLTPDYSFGCKRPTFSNRYFRTFTRDNVALVTTPIARIEPDAIVTADGQRRAIDTLVLATGFNLWQKGNFPAFDVVGRGGVELGDLWNRNHYQSYEGITVPGFPNLFNIHSPYLVQRLLLLQHHRDPDAAHGPLPEGNAPSRRRDLRADARGAGAVRRADAQPRRRHRVQRGAVRDRQQLLLQPARRGHLVALVLGAGGAATRGPLPARRLPLRLECGACPRSSTRSGSATSRAGTASGWRR